MEYVYIALEVVGAASLIVAGLGKIAGITSTTKDDAIVGKISKYLSYAVTVLEKLALNPKK